MINITKQTVVLLRNRKKEHEFAKVLEQVLLLEEDLRHTGGKSYKGYAVDFIGGLTQITLTVPKFAVKALKSFADKLNRQMPVKNSDE
jgi:hypothetical protein